MVAKKSYFHEKNHENKIQNPTATHKEGCRRLCLSFDGDRAVAQFSCHTGELLCRSHTEKTLMGIRQLYADKEITMTTTSNNSKFMRMLADFDTRKIDIILSKSILSFSSNTVHLFETVRQLKNFGIEVRFEKGTIRINGNVKVVITRAITNMKLSFENKLYK